MSEIPIDLFREILICVPVKYLLPFRSVCKEWCNIIDDSHFIKSHLEHQTAGPGNEQLIFIQNYIPISTLYVLHLKSVEYSKGCAKSINVMEALRQPGVPPIDYLPVASCDGLILISQENVDKVWALWNPFTRELLELPISPLSKKECEDWDAYGLGYDSLTCDYKIVIIYDFFDVEYMCFFLKTVIYSMKLGCWKTIDNFRNCYAPSTRNHGIFLNGTLHWISYVYKEKTKVKSIIAFNLGTENYSILPLPPFISKYSVNLDKLDGCLFLGVHNEHGISGLDGWIMKEYEGEHVWVKLFSFNADKIGGSVKLNPVAYLKSKNQVLFEFFHGGKLVWFDIEKKSFVMRVSITGIPSDCSYQVIPASLVKLNLRTSKRKVSFKLNSFNYGI